ncbi:MAG: arsenate reductase/protein-tyrosine-phosphatase family protein [Actinomycetota bacterium]
MSAILVVCTGNVCRSPLAEGIVRHALRGRVGEEAPTVSSAGVAGWEGSPATAESVAAARELGIDISGHIARRLTPEMIAGADLILAMAEEHRRLTVAAVPSAAPRTFTMKELVVLLETAPPVPLTTSGGSAARLTERLATASHLQEAGAFRGAGDDHDMADPLGMPMDTYRDLAGELDDLTARMVVGLYGRGALGAPADDEGAVA